MPTVYRRRARIPELKGQVRGGLAVIVHSPAEVAGLESLVDTATALPGDTLDNLYRVLANAGSSPTFPPGAPTTTNDVGSGDNVEGGELLDPRVHALRKSLSLSAQIWRAQKDDVDQLALALVLPRPGRRATFKSRRPALVLDYGSIRARVLAAGGKLRQFGVALFPVSRSKRKANLVQALRDHAIGVRLPRLQTLQASDLADKSGVVIFLHGLMSTDVGTFDEFVKLLQAAPDLRRKLLLISWPHDTLDSIKLNAKSLSKLVKEKLGPSSLPIAFVCHSRGGLVARRTAVELQKVNNEPWQSRVRGLVTFGTPHDGAELAENGDEFLGKLLLVLTMANAGLVPLVDALWAVKGRKKLDGITDLRPRSNGGDFLRKLQNAEGRIAKKAGAVPLRLFAVGGNAKGGFAGMLSRRYFGGASNDLIVPLASTTPATSERTAEALCSHFTYFTREEVGRDPAKEAVSFLQSTMMAPQADAKPRQSSRTQPELPRRRTIKYGSDKLRARA